MRFDLLHQVMHGALRTPTITLRMVEDGLRHVLRNDPDPMHVERAVGHLYGHAFKKREELYDVAHSISREGS